MNLIQYTTINDYEKKKFISYRNQKMNQSQFVISFKRDIKNEIAFINGILLIINNIQQLFIIITENIKMFFQQDNAIIYVVSCMKKCFEKYTIKLLLL